MPHTFTLTKNIYVEGGYVRVVRFGGKKDQRYKVSTFLSSYKRLDERKCREILENLHDYRLLLKLRRGELHARDILECRNATIRRDLIAGFGFERFVNKIGGTVINRDGSSELIRVDWHKDERPIVVVKVKDSTTHKIYLLRVPPDMRTCKQAVAWTFGLEEKEYDPQSET